MFFEVGVHEGLGVHLRTRVNVVDDGALQLLDPLVALFELGLQSAYCL
jgi:hypothetical protein